MTTTKDGEIKIGSVGFGQVNGFPPSRWRLVGKRNGAWILEHIKHTSQSTAYPPQGVDWATVSRLMED